MESLRIPFVISPHEKALASVYSYLNEQYLGEETRWRLVKTERIAAGKVSITGKLFYERLSAENSYEIIQESLEYTVNEANSIENIAYCQAMIKLIYFCLISMGNEPENWRFVNEEQKTIKKLYEPEVSWEEDMKKNGIDTEEMFKRKGSLSEIKMYINSKTSASYPTAMLVSEAKKAFKTTKLSGQQLLKFIYGQKKYRAYKSIEYKKPAKRAVGIPQDTPIGAQPIPRKAVRNEPIARDAGEIVSLREKFRLLGVGKTNYKERLPKQAALYSDLSLFIANAPDGEIAEAMSLISK